MQNPDSFDLVEAAAHGRVWDIEAIPLQAAVEDHDRRRPVAVVVAAGGFVLYADILPWLSGEIDDVADALEQTVINAAADIEIFPSVVAVRHPEVERPLRERLGSRGIEVEVALVLPGLEEAVRNLMAELTGQSMWPPGCAVESWSSWGLPDTTVADLFAAAAAYWRAAPWRTVVDTQAPLVTGPSGRAWTAAVLGQAGDQIGLTLYSDEGDIVRTVSASRDPADFDCIHGQLISLNFDSVSALGDIMVRDAREHHWEVNGPDAFPVLFTMNALGGGISRADAEDLLAILRAMPAYVARHRGLLLREERSHRYGDAVEWRDPETGCSFSYDGEANARKLAEVGYQEDRGEPDLPDLLDGLLSKLADALGDDPNSADILRNINARAALLGEAYNEEPQVALGGLAPDQVQQLLNADWFDPADVVRLERDLRLDQVEPAPMLFNVRTLLTLAEERGGLPATPAGNLQVAIVNELLHRCRLEPDFLESLRRVTKRITEQDAWPVHMARLLAETAGLLSRRKGKFAITRQGRSLFVNQRAGELFARLFATRFRKSNLAYGRFGDEWPELQHQIAFTVYQLRTRPPEWRTPDRLMRMAVLPFALEHGPESDYHDLAAILFAHRVLDELVDFALLERRPAAGSKDGLDYEYRKMSLFDDFLHVQFRSRSSGS